MPDSTPTESVQSLLGNVLSRGKELAAKPVASVTVANVWVMRARTAVAKIYGPDAKEIDIWCPPPASDRERSPQEKVSHRLAQLEQLAHRLAAPKSQRVFIGHGRSSEWLKLQSFLSRDLALQCEEFNAEPMAGIQTTTRIESMLSSATMAFLILTADDSHNDGTLHARQNVAHEVGLFQARLGHRRAIVMLERGCGRFSNLDGLTTIDFPEGDIMARSEEVRRVLLREGLL